LPIPGTTRPAHLTDNLGAGRLVLSAATLQQLDTSFAPEAVAGARYNAASQLEVDTEVFVA